jgi:hypothetical protein
LKEKVRGVGSPPSIETVLRNRHDTAERFAALS